MKRVLVSSGSGSGNPADEVQLASALRLLARRSHLCVLALSADLPASTRAHPGIAFTAQAEIDAALAESTLLVIAGDLRDPLHQTRAATELVRAKRIGVPVALLAVRLAPPAGTDADADLLPLLAQAESLSGCDATSSWLLAGHCGRRVETASPLEMGLELDVEMQRDGARSGGTIAVNEALVRSGEGSLVEALAAAAAAGADVVVLGSGVGSGEPELPPPRFEPRSATDWRAWLQLALASDVVVDAADSTLLHVAAAHGVRPVALATAREPPRLHARIGLAHLAVPQHADTGCMSRALELARGTSTNEVLARSAPLRALVWRALGPLADAPRSRPLELTGLSAGVRAFTTAIWEEREAAALAPAGLTGSMPLPGGVDADVRPAPRP